MSMQLISAKGTPNLCKYCRKEIAIQWSSIDPPIEFGIFETDCKTPHRCSRAKQVFGDQGAANAHVRRLDREK